jgi:hypothetical protein
MGKNVAQLFFMFWSQVVSCIYGRHKSVCPSVIDEKTWNLGDRIAFRIIWPVRVLYDLWACGRVSYCLNDCKIRR